MKKIILFIFLILSSLSTEAQVYNNQYYMMRDSINRFQSNGQKSKANNLTWKVITQNDSLSTILRIDLITEQLKDSKVWQKEALKYLSYKDISDKLSVYDAVENMQPDSTFFVDLNKNFNKLDANTKASFITWMMKYNAKGENKNTLYMQDRIIEMLYTSKDNVERIEIGKCLQTYPNELSLLALCNLLKSENIADIDVAKAILMDFDAKNLDKELRQVLFNNKNEYQKLAVLEIYKHKRNSENLPEVIALLSSDDNENIQFNGYQTIAIIADKDQLETLEVLALNAPDTYKYLLDNKIKELKDEGE